LAGDGQGGKLAKAGHIVDAAKDTLKFVVRSGQKVIPSAGLHVR
jgi:hypothetical protein